MSRDYRLEKAEFQSSTPLGVIYDFVFAIDSDMPSGEHLDLCRSFLGDLDANVARLYSSYFAADAIVQGGEWMVFERLSGPMIKFAIEGFQMLNKGQEADKLIEACRFFPEDRAFSDPDCYLAENRDDWFDFIANHDTKIYIQTISDFFDYEHFIKSNSHLIFRD